MGRGEEAGLAGRTTAHEPVPPSRPFTDVDVAALVHVARELVDTWPIGTVLTKHTHHQPTYDDQRERLRAALQPFPGKEF